MKTKHPALWVAAPLAVFLLVYSDAAAEEGAKTVIGPRNVYLADGTTALRAGDAEEGVELTLRGLETALGNRERRMAPANLCAGYLLLDRPTAALAYCNDVLDGDPKNWRSYTNRALVYLQLGRYEESDADIRRGTGVDVSPCATARTAYSRGLRCVRSSVRAGCRLPKKKRCLHSIPAGRSVFHSARSRRMPISPERGRACASRLPRASCRN